MAFLKGHIFLLSGRFHELLPVMLSMTPTKCISSALDNIPLIFFCRYRHIITRMTSDVPPQPLLGGILADVSYIHKFLILINSLCLPRKGDGPWQNTECTRPHSLVP